jgi:RNA polymerase sigma-70 factor, ECF subfamily
MTGESDRLLVQQIRGGGSKAGASWEELVSRYEGRLRAYVRRRLRDSSTTDDVVQETFIGFLNSLANYDDKRELQTWLFTIASYKVTDHLRKTGRRPFHTGSESDEEQLGKATDGKQRAASSMARSKERVELETDAVTRALREIVDGFRTKGEWVRVQVGEQQGGGVSEGERPAGGQLPLRGGEETDRGDEGRRPAGRRVPGTDGGGLVIRIRRIVYPTDFSSYSTQAYFHAVGLAEQYRAALDVVFVYDPAADAHARGKTAWEERLADIRPLNAGIPVRHAVLEGDAAAEIVKYATDQRADVIVIGTHGRTAADKPGLGSGAERVMRDAPCSVLVVRLAQRRG